VILNVEAKTNFVKLLILFALSFSGKKECLFLCHYISQNISERYVNINWYLFPVNRNPNCISMNTKLIFNFVLAILSWFIGILPANGQTFSVRFDLADLCRKNQFETINRQLSWFYENDKKAVRLSKSKDEGIAWIKGVQFSNGTIEIDIRGKDIFQESFTGIAFHGSDIDTLDAVYFRPFNFQSTDSVRRTHAVQYISHPEFPWSVLREKYAGKYENGVTPSPDGNEWFHIRIVVQYPDVTVYVNGSDIPCLSIKKLNGRRTGKIGLWAGNNSDGDFANLVISTTRKR